MHSINILVIVLENIGRHDYSHEALINQLRKLNNDEQEPLFYASFLEYHFSTREELEAFTNGMSAVQGSDEYAYIWEDEHSPEYEAQHKDYEAVKEIIEDYL